MKPAGNPWMKFYPSDWRADPALRACSISARGLWIEMLCIMHEADPYGSLLVKGKRINKKQLASLCGIPERECVTLMIELEGFEVFERDHDGTIYSRRMRRDHAKASEDRKNGKIGGNPNIKGGDNGGVNPPDNGGVKAQKPEARMDRIGHAGASGFTTGSKALALAFWKALGFDSPLAVPPEYAGTDRRAVEWERAGWTADLIDAVARKTGHKPLTYHEKCFATEFAKRQAPLPVVEIKQPEKITVMHGKSQGNSNSLIAAIDRKIAALEAEDGTDFALPESSILRISS